MMHAQLVVSVLPELHAQAEARTTLRDEAIRDVAITKAESVAS